MIRKDAIDRIDRIETERNKKIRKEHTKMEIQDLDKIERNRRA